jgi:hypothetical protein
MDDTQIYSIIALALSIGSAIITAINHKRIRSNCCGIRQEVSIDIDNTTPSSDKKNTTVIIADVSEPAGSTNLHITKPVG